MNRVLRGYPYAKAAIDVALHDAIGKIYGVPVYQLLGGKVRDGTELAHSIGIMDADAAAREAAEVVAEGITTIKVKIGVEAERDIEVVAAVREAIGSAGKIRVDANQGYRTWREAVRVITAMEKYDLVYAEQPVEGLRAMAEVSARINVPVMADESAWTAEDVLEIVRLNAAQMLSVYYTKPGGLARAKRLLAVAGAASLPCDINGSAEMGIGVAADLHLAVSSPEISLPGTIPVTSTAETVVTKVAGRKYLDDLIKTPFRFEKGCSTCPTGPASASRSTRRRSRNTASDDAVRRSRPSPSSAPATAAARRRRSLSLRGFDIRLYGRSRGTTEPLRAIGGVEYEGVLGDGFAPLPLITNDAGAAIAGADLVLIMAPTHAHEDVARTIAPHLAHEQLRDGGARPHAAADSEHHPQAGGELGTYCDSSSLPFICRKSAPSRIRITRVAQILYFAAFPGDELDAMAERVRPRLSADRAAAVAAAHGVPLHQRHPSSAGAAAQCRPRGIDRRRLSPLLRRHHARRRPPDRCARCRADRGRGRARRRDRAAAAVLLPHGLHQRGRTRRRHRLRRVPQQRAEPLDQGAGHASTIASSTRTCRTGSSPSPSSAASPACRRRARTPSSTLPRSSPRAYRERGYTRSAWASPA